MREAIHKKISQLEKAIEAQDRLRPACGDDLVELTIAALKKQITELRQNLLDTKIPATSRELLPGLSAEFPGKIKMALKGERRLVTVMFVDISGFTAMSETMEPEWVRDLMNACYEQLIPVVEKYGGYLDKILGDGMMVLFGAPTAHENDPELAVRAALDIIETLNQFNVVHQTNLGIHFGINTGLVIAGGIGTRHKQEYSVMGDPVNLASRLGDLSERGQILVGMDTYRLTSSIFDYQEMRPIRVKGKAEPVTLYKVLGIKARPDSRRVAGARGIRSPLVGREKEFAVFTACIESLLSGKGGIVSVIGEAGLGKSRLLAEVGDQVIRRGLTWLEGRTLPFSRTISYWPFLEIIRNYAGISEKDTEAGTWAKLENRITALFPDQVAEILPYLASLITLEVRGELEERVKYLDGEAMGHQIFLSIRRFFEKLAQTQPLVLVFEDLHWVDQSTLELLEHLLPLVESTPLLICGVSRPERQSPAARLREIAAKDYAGLYTEIPLLPLSQANVHHLVCNLVQIDDKSSQVIELILNKAEGNPFFLEEVIRSLIDMKALVRYEGTGKWHAVSQMEQITLPDTIHGVIMARVDRLADEVKEGLKAASVIGRSFFYRILKSITEAGLELDLHLAELQQVELIRQKNQAPELEYIFEHALVQEATYQSILFQRRRGLHRRVGETIEALFSDRLEEFYGLLAYHYAGAEDWEKAQEYLFKVGDQAGKVAADAEALAHYQLALAAYARAFGNRWDPFKRAVLERKMGEALFRRGKHQQAREYLNRALTHLRAPLPTSNWGIRLVIVSQSVRQVAHRILPRLFLGDTSRCNDLTVEEQSRIHGVLGWIDYFMNQERLLLIALAELNFSERKGFSLGIVTGSMGMGLIFDLLPLFRLAELYHRRALTIAKRLQHPVALGHACFGFGFHQYYLAKWEAAIELLRESAEAYWEAGHLRGWGAATAMIARIYYSKGDFKHSLEQSYETLRLGQDGADPQVWGWGLQGLGQIQCCTGPLEEAETNLKKALELFQSIPDYPTIAETNGDLGQCYLRQGKLEEAIELLEHSNQMVEARRLRGHIVSSPRNGLAEAYLKAAERDQAIEKPKALRKAKSAVRIAVKQGKDVRGGLPQAVRLRGALAWLTGEPALAQKWWQRSLTLAESLEARYELGKTYLEMGSRMRAPDYLQLAKTVFKEIGAETDLTQMEIVLKSLSANLNRNCL